MSAKKVSTSLTIHLPVALATKLATVAEKRRQASVTPVPMNTIVCELLAKGMGQ